MAEAPKYAACCKSCGHIEDKAWTPATDTEHSKPTQEQLTPRGHVPMYCQKCGARSWRVPATKEDIEKFEAAKRRVARATELCTKLPNYNGLHKIPDEVRSAPEVQNALSNLFAPLEGKALELAQKMVVRVARSGVAAPSEFWIEMYDNAVASAIKQAKGGAAEPAGAGAGK